VYAKPREVDGRATKRSVGGNASEHRPSEQRAWNTPTLRNAN